MEIIFEGESCGGSGLFAKEIKLPSPVKQLEIISKWPHSFEPGTFNIQVKESKWPTIEGLGFSSQGVQCLDRSELFKPALYLNYSVVPENTLNPNNKGEHGGDLQFWRAKLEIEAIDDVINCYMLRRVKSNYRNKIELISDCHIRSKYNLDNDVKVKLIIYDNAY